jgi:hypothetical protein
MFPAPDKTTRQSRPPITRRLRALLVQAWQRQRTFEAELRNRGR